MVTYVRFGAKRSFPSRKTGLAIALSLAFSLVAKAETVTIYVNSDIPQHAFAMGDIKSALEKKGFGVSMQTLGALSPAAQGPKIVVATKNDALALQQLKSEGGQALGNLIPQAYGIRSTGTQALSQWVVGGDINGAMYGALQVAENIGLQGWGQKYDTEESPHILHRGIKFNLPFDARSPTYYGNGFSQTDFKGTSHQLAIEHVWDLEFWREWFDEMARMRYNVLQMWSLHPFTSMIKLPDYPNVALQDIQGFHGFTKKMSIDEKITFWREVMTLAKNRGFEFHFMIWNLYTYGATGKYGITNDPKNAATAPYMRKCIYKLFETYPDLTGFGVTSGENMGGMGDAQEAKWMWSSFGQGILDFANAHKDREIVFVHRYHDAGGDAVAQNFKPLIDAPNVRFDFSFKYAVAHIYSTTSPDWIRTRNGDVPQQLASLNLKTWLELRNDSFYYLHWGNPEFVREYIGNFPQADKYIQGFVAGQDGFVPTRVFLNKAVWTKNQLELKRHWYTHTLWGRLSYNPDLPDGVFAQLMGQRYPGAGPGLFSAWAKASEGVPKITELLQGTWKADYLWWPEAMKSLAQGFRTIANFTNTEPPPGSKACSIKKTAAKTCGVLKSAVLITDEVEGSSLAALGHVGLKGPVNGNELEVDRGNIRAMAYLGLHLAEKVRAAVALSAKQNAAARTHAGQAWCHWQSYSLLMDSMYKGMNMQRTTDLANWLSLEDEVYKDYTALGGQGTPNCKDPVVSTLPDKAKLRMVESLSLHQGVLTGHWPTAGEFSLTVFSVGGRRLESRRIEIAQPGTHSLKLPHALSNTFLWVKVEHHGNSQIIKLPALYR